MKTQQRTLRDRRSVTRPAAVRFGALVLLASLSACQAKPADFFAPPSSSSTSQNHASDNTPPVFINPFPAAILAGPFRINSTRIEIEDLIGSNRASASGVDPLSVGASINGQSLPVTHSANTYTASLDGRADGQLGIVWSAKDLAGNLGTFQTSYYLKNTGPSIAVPTPPPGTSQSSGASTSFSVAGTIADQFLFKATGTVLKPGPSNVCGNADNTPWPLGSGPGQVSGNSWDYTNSVLSNGSFNLGATAFNAVSPGGMQTTVRYCFGVTAEDKATDGSGVANHNVTTRYFTVDQTWMPPVVTFTLSTTATYRHIAPGSSEVCVSINTTPAQTSGSYQLGISGPGVVGSTNLTGSLSSGVVIVRVPINQFGTYAGTVAVGSHTAEFSVNVTSAPGTCT